MRTSKENAKRVLNHYFKVAGVSECYDNNIEIKGIVDDIIKATKEEIKEEVKSNLIKTSDLTVDDLFENMSNKEEKKEKNRITHWQLIKKARGINGEDLGELDLYTDKEGNTYSGFRAWKVSSNPKVATLVDASNIMEYGSRQDISETESEEETTFYQVMKIEISHLSEKDINKYVKHLDTNKKEVWVSLANKVLSITNKQLSNDKEKLKLVEGYEGDKDNELAIKKVTDVAKNIFKDFYSSYYEKE